ncbi:cytochrome c oxidase subunit 3 [Buchnera aphidicola (Mindarus keteleerifoliae)]|uniref:cytochrome c oxidase subunit 3 n=1 Tax=Buchnera aphidicola TaxID=9 RepID=UPI0031B6F564
MLINNFNKKINISKKQDVNEKVVFGFWLYLISDCILFATIFSVYAVMTNSVSYSWIEKSFFNTETVAWETFFLLCSSITYGIANILVNYNKKKYLFFFLVITFLLGFSFITLEFFELYSLVLKGYTPKNSAFLSSFFVLVGTHGIHIFSGLIWMLILIINIKKMGLIKKTITQVKCLGFFWHFLDVIWICIFTFVYLLGKLV